jgi:hypothetical protein
MVVECERAPIVFSLSGGNAYDSPEGEKLFDKFRRVDEQIYINGQSIREKKYVLQS